MFQRYSLADNYFSERMRVSAKRVQQRIKMIIWKAIF